MDLFEAIFPPGTPERSEYDRNIHSREPDPIKGSGYVVDTLHSAVWALEQGDFEAVLKAAISLGHDTDTTACVAGGVAGLRDGAAAIPKRWMAKLRGKEMVEPLLERILDRA
jgi:ADP-ribosylglycohydrolase